MAQRALGRCAMDFARRSTACAHLEFRNGSLAASCGPLCCRIPQVKELREEKKKKKTPETELRRKIRPCVFTQNSGLSRPCQAPAAPQAGRCSGSAPPFFLPPPPSGARAGTAVAPPPPPTPPPPPPTPPSPPPPPPTLPPWWWGGGLQITANRERTAHLGWCAVFLLRPLARYATLRNRERPNLLERRALVERSIVCHAARFRVVLNSSMASANCAGHHCAESSGTGSRPPRDFCLAPARRLRTYRFRWHAIFESLV